jgi:3-mercaptopyruvate sulfurtransferase SseA
MTLVLMLTALLSLLAPAAAAQDVPLLVDAPWLHARLGGPEIRVVDMVTEAKDYRSAHVPGAVHLSVDDIRMAVKEGGYRLPSLLDGGIQAWRRAGLPVSRDVPSITPTTYRPTPRPELVADEAWILKRLDDPNVVLLDTRSVWEYRGMTSGRGARVTSPGPCTSNGAIPSARTRRSSRSTICGRCTPPAASRPTRR